MNLTIAAAAFCNWRLAEATSRQLAAGLQPVTTELTTDASMQQLAHSLNSSTGGAVVFYAPLELALEQAMLEGIEPSQAVALWQHNGTQLVRFCKQHRGQAVLFNLADALAAPEVFKTLCAQHWPELKPGQAPTQAGEHQPPLLCRLLARFWLSTPGTLQTLSQQLTALAQPLLPEPQPLPTHAELNQLVKEYQAGLQAQQQLPEVQQEHALLLEQLHQVQQALESALREQEQQKNALKAEQDNRETLVSRVNQLQQQLDTLTKERDTALQSASAELQQENALLLEQLFTVQEELEKHLVITPRPAVAGSPQVAKPTDAKVAQHNASSSQPSEHPSSLRRYFKKRAEKKRLLQKAAELAASPLFNAEWYLGQYPDVAADKVFAKNPALHYFKCGGFEGRNPSPQFNSRDYLDANPDVAATGFNPLYHYLRFGQAENRPLY
ncbi:hypothetical protein [Zobellella denitrificans]